MKIKHEFIRLTTEGQLITIGKQLTKLFREERVEMLGHQAHAMRPYAERVSVRGLSSGSMLLP